MAPDISKLLENLSLDTTNPTNPNINSGPVVEYGGDPMDISPGPLTSPTAIHTTGAQIHSTNPASRMVTLYNAAEEEDEGKEEEEEAAAAAAGTLFVKLTEEEVRTLHATLKHRLTAAMNMLRAQPARYEAVPFRVRRRLRMTVPGMWEWRTRLTGDQTMHGGVGVVLLETLDEVENQINDDGNGVPRTMVGGVRDAVHGAWCMLRDMEESIAWVEKGAEEQEKTIVQLEGMVGVY